MKKISVFLSVLFLFAFYQEALSISEKSGLYYVLKDRKVYMYPVEDKTSEIYPYRDHLRQLILNKLRFRAFEIVNNPEKADILIACQIIERNELTEDPVDFIVTPFSAVIDAVMINQYIRVKTFFEVTDKRGNLLWKKPILATITDKTISFEKNYRAVNDRLSDVFIRECFSRGKSSVWTKA